jgi:hypothetical protein
VENGLKNVKFLELESTLEAAVCPILGGSLSSEVERKDMVSMPQRVRSSRASKEGD